MKKVDTHVHTCEVSRCGHVPGAEMARLYIQAGYDAILITDHFILPEVAESGKTPEETVEAQMRGYRAALEGAGDNTTEVYAQADGTLLPFNAQSTPEGTTAGTENG